MSNARSFHITVFLTGSVVIIFGLILACAGGGATGGRSAPEGGDDDTEDDDDDTDPSGDDDNDTDGADDDQTDDDQTGGDDDDDVVTDDDNNSDFYCPLDGEGVGSVAGSLDNDDCKLFMIYISLGSLASSTDQTRYAVSGAFEVGSDNAYFLRTPGLETDCYEPITGTGGYHLLAEFPSCRDTFTIDVVEHMDNGAPVWCRLRVTADERCPAVDDKWTPQ
ncbi:MAG: hypothetical protein M5R36_17010 [Deltaproteobacteria bacterium]|nr:hypothetical protein [Deltaproteobacteria bacterium]